MFGSTAAADEPVVEKSSSLGRFAIYAGILVLGAVLGFGALYLATSRPEPPPDTGVNQLSEMRSANIPLSAFEENRRNVDKDPAGYIAKFGGDPQDSEDFYLVGRAHMLTGDFPKARAAITEARNRLSEADPANAGVLANDIAIAIAVMNDTTVQTNLRKEFEAAKLGANSNTSPNVNR
jgi:cytochrome c-type biogenesis protein CcmH/NrfG